VEYVSMNDSTVSNLEKVEGVLENTVEEMFNSFFALSNK